jgi:hypothetical protein
MKKAFNRNIYEERKCVQCNKTFKKNKSHGRARLKKDIRGKNCITCSPECSRKYHNDNKKNYDKTRYSDKINHKKVKYEKIKHKK